jgi:hypothetical protein
VLPSGARGSLTDELIDALLSARHWHALLWEMNPTEILPRIIELVVGSCRFGEGLWVMIHYLGGFSRGVSSAPSDRREESAHGHGVHAECGCTESAASLPAGAAGGLELTRGIVRLRRHGAG